MIEIELPAHEDVRFLEEQWVRIAHELGPNAVQSREQLEVCAADLVWRRKRFLGLEQFSSAEHTERLLEGYCASRTHFYPISDKLSFTGSISPAE